MRRFAILIAIPLALAGCSNDGRLRDLRSDSQGPDEFLIKPSKPLEAPASYSDLPPPTPGQANLTDRSALNEGIVAFGGNPAVANAGIPAADSALVRHAGRDGVAGNIRATLAEEDAAFRKRKARFTNFRLVPVDRYSQAYRQQSLDAFAEERRWRGAGARTPSNPPASRPRFR